ncbi:MAG TPA: tetratricopeptide repeat protein [Phenylobacterium sp.]|uniref:tetratricopeptide repeat protein n=1 Tax=Phenylobacterium sp. TaxID=1871053 RepID=UPI002D6D9061|nr:tetratricopeptide repeat protein [Phenylobacterium sp.]HZZ67051.1 tetratricopeptide repeat protein [Phenylobacterium sp.]
MSALSIGRGIGIAIAFACVSGAVGISPAFAYPVSRDTQAAMELLQKKDYRGALEAADKVLKAHPNDAVARATRGNAYIELGDYEHALLDHDAVLAQVGDNPGALVNACWVRALANLDLDRARIDCDKAVAKRHSLAGFDTRGFLDIRQGAFKAAIADYDEALKVRPKTASSLYGRGLAKIRVGDDTGGQADMAAARQLQPDIAEVYLRRGLKP